MGLFDGVLGGVVGAGMVSVVSDIIAKHGGLQGVVDQFQKQGLGPTVKSWIAMGPNMPISADQVHQALGSDFLKQLADKAGMPVESLTKKLAEVLPQAVDKMTPGGVIPKS